MGGKLRTVKHGLHRFATELEPNRTFDTPVREVHIPEFGIRDISISLNSEPDIFKLYSCKHTSPFRERSGPVDMPFQFSVFSGCWKRKCFFLRHFGSSVMICLISFWNQCCQ